MAENPPESTDTSTDYDVVLLVEQALSDADAQQVRSLHEGLDEPVTYHVLLPVDDAAAQIEAAMGSVTGHDLVPGPSIAVPPPDLAEIAKETRDRANADLEATLTALRTAGASAEGQVVSAEPIQALADKVKAIDGREAIILTRPHVVAEFFHVDWTSKARRKIGVPVLHLLEHENFDEQAGGGEGVSGV
ncbi:MAG TPA: hypothetical protein VFV89_24175 [Nocardioides sp.]|uniref:hypothetical protein n=1 Tax=Nocardioides sp. TaxID=35761 RepID=UPI002E3122FD|nr:hypothetical protein [Nocardioides sp.]HEX5090930.1 hypothetical protein [Nocardioides sp.]